MRFSIVLPTYNVGKYINRCLVSCGSQTYRDIEILVVDDCGQDNSIQQAECFAKTDPRVKIIRNISNLGTYHARRVGVENATGEYILFLDPDDTIELDAIERVTKLIEKKSDLIFYGVRDIPPKKIWQAISCIPRCSESLTYEENVDEILSCSRLRFGTGGKIFRREVLESAYSLLGIESERHLVYGEDVLLFFAVILEMRSCHSVEENLYNYYKSEESITSAINNNQLLRNIEQLEFVIGKVRELPALGLSAQRARKVMVERLVVDKLRLSKKLTGGFVKVFGRHFAVLKETKNFRDFVKLVIFVVTLGKKNI